MFWIYGEEGSYRKFCSLRKLGFNELYWFSKSVKRVFVLSVYFEIIQIMSSLLMEEISIWSILTLACCSLMRRAIYNFVLAERFHVCLINWKHFEGDLKSFDENLHWMKLSHVYYVFIDWMTYLIAELTLFNQCVRFGIRVDDIVVRYLKLM